MSSTNKTTYYQLSQYVGTDIINPLTDFNGDNEKIDTALHNIAEAAGSSAADITALAGRVTTEEGKVTALENQNGNAVLVTTAQTLSGAINELKSVNDTQNSTLSAHTTSIDNLNSRTTAVETSVDTLIDDVDAFKGGTYKKLIKSVQGDGTTKIGAVIQSLFSGVSLTLEEFSHSKIAVSDANGTNLYSPQNYKNIGEYTYSNTTSESTTSRNAFWIETLVSTGHNYQCNYYSDSFHFVDNATATTDRLFVLYIE